MLKIVGILAGLFALTFLVLWIMAVITGNHKPVNFFTLYAKRVMKILAILLFLAALIDGVIFK